MGADLPTAFTRAELEAVGFVGWRTWDELRASGFREIPRAASAYVVYRMSRRRPRFVDPGTGGHYQGRDPNVPIATVEAKWVAGARVLYIGKADVLRTRLRTYARFGAGEPVAHRGGRYIWQLADAQTLLVAWRVVDDGSGAARADEVRLLDRFRGLHDGRLPFANLSG